MVTVTPLVYRDPLSFAKLVLQAIRNPVESWSQLFYEQPIVIYRSFGRTICFAMDPEAIHTVLHHPDCFSKKPLYGRVLGRPAGQGLLVAEGESWRGQRRLTAPVFNHDALLSYAPAMTQAAERLLGRWREADSGSVNMTGEMDRLAYEIIQATVLRADVPVEFDALAKAIDDFMSHVTWPIVYASLGLPRWMPFPHKRRADAAGRYLRRVAGEVMTGRRQKPRVNDLLQTLLDTADQKVIPEDLVVDNVVTFLMAGYETLAKTMAWTFYLLASSPDWQNRIAQEVLDVAGDSPLGRDHARSLVLTRDVFQEAMRLYAPAPSLVRFTQNHARLCGIDLKPGSIIVIPIYVIHRHRLLWERPDEFDPTRFTRVSTTDRRRCAYLPFSEGPRSCIGGSYSMLAGTLVLGTLVRQMQFARLEETAPLARVTLHTKRPMRLAITPRAQRKSIAA